MFRQKKEPQAEGQAVSGPKDDILDLSSSPKDPAGRSEAVDLGEGIRKIGNRYIFPARRILQSGNLRP